MRALHLAVATMLVAAAAPSQAALVHDYQLNGSLADSVPGGVALTPSSDNGAIGIIGSQFYSYSPGSGLALTSQLPGSIYTIEMKVGLADVSGYRKLISFNSLDIDTGLYNYNGQLNLFNVAISGTNDFTIGGQVVIRLSRDASGLMTAFIDGVQKFTYIDTSNAFTATNGLWFVRDDRVQNSEHGSGRLDYIRIFDSAEPAVGGAVPEPATWALMIAGFGGIGAAMRRRRAPAVRIA